MNPLPTRPIINNASLPVSLPNVPSFDQMGYNTRPRKLMPEVGKEFPLMNGMNMMSGPSTTPSSGPGQISTLDRSSPNPGLQQQSQTPQLHASAPMTHQFQQSQQGLQTQDAGKDREFPESQQTTAIFRPDDAGEWKERLRQAHESEQARLASEVANGSSWQGQDDDDVKEEDDTEDDVSSVLGEGDGTKVWKAKRTLRKSV